MAKKNSKKPGPAFYATVITVGLALLIILTISIVKLFQASKIYSDEAREHDYVLQYKPDIPSGLPHQTDPSSGDGNTPTLPGDPTETSEPGTEETDVNEGAQKLGELIAQYPDVIGWLYVPATNIDYPFVQSADNSYYIHRGIAGNYIYSGTPFLDYACASDFSDRNSVIYGHNMKNGSMFSTLGNYKDASVFSENKYFYIVLPDQTLTVEIFACSVINSYSEKSSFVYNVAPGESYLDDLRASARRFRELDFMDTDRYVTISTCDYEFGGARVVLIGRIIE